MNMLGSLIMAMTRNGFFKDGNKTTKWLLSIGITDIKQASEIGVIEVCMMIKKMGFPVSLNLAHGLQGELMGLPWNKLPDEVKLWIKTEYTSHCLISTL